MSNKKIVLMMAEGTYNFCEFLKLTMFHGQAYFAQFTSFQDNDSIDQF